MEFIKRKREGERVSDLFMSNLFELSMHLGKGLSVIDFLVVGGNLIKV